MKKFLLVMMGVMVLFGMNVKAEGISVSNNSKDATVAYVAEAEYGFELTWGSMEFDYSYNGGAGEWYSNSYGVNNKIIVTNTSNVSSNVDFAWSTGASYTGVTSTFLNWSATPEKGACESEIKTEGLVVEDIPFLVYHYSDATCETSSNEFTNGQTYYYQAHTYPTITTKTLAAEESITVGVNLNMGTYTGTPVTGETIGSIALNFSK